MKNNLEFIGNARVIKSLDELPRIGEKHKRLMTDNYCISINAFEYEDIKKSVNTDLADDDAEKYLWFEVWYCEDRGKYMAIWKNTFHFLYCILKENI